jgi:transposase
MKISKRQRNQNCLAVMMPQSMIQRRLEIIQFILRGHSNHQIEKNTGHCHKLCAAIRKSLTENPGAMFVQEAHIGSPKKCTEVVRARIDELTTKNRRMTNDECAHIISQELCAVSREAVRVIRSSLGFSYLPPIRTFFLTPRQIRDRLAFAQRDLAHPREWGSVIFTDESYFWLGEDNRALWRKRGERGPDIELQTVKFPKKILVFKYSIWWNIAEGIIFLDDLPRRPSIADHSKSSTF